MDRKWHSEPQSSAWASWAAGCLTTWARHPGYAPDLLWDPSPDACAHAVQIAPSATIADSAQAAIADADLVYLACPPGPRKTLALLAAGMGKPVFLEKPLGVDLEESRDLVTRLHASGVPIAVNFTQAACPAMKRLTRAAESGAMGRLVGADIIVTYAAWPRAWQAEADWLRFRAEGGPTREVISHFLFVSGRLLGPLTLTWARPSFPDDAALCETHLLARLASASGAAVSVMASVGGAQPDRQELTLKGSKVSHRLSDFYVDAVSDGGPFTLQDTSGDAPRIGALRGQLDDLLLLVAGRPNRLATLDEALKVQILVETMLAARDAG